jgi:hypothetical protein
MTAIATVNSQEKLLHNEPLRGDCWMGVFGRGLVRKDSVLYIEAG